MYPQNLTSKRNFTVFCRLFVCSYAGCSYPVTGQIFQNKASFFIGCHNFSRTRAHEKRSFAFKNLTSNRIRASRIAIHTRNRQNTVTFRLFMEFLSRTLSRKIANRLVKLLILFMFVLFLKLVSFYISINYGFISCVYFTKFKELPTLGNSQKFTIYATAIESRVRKYQFLLQF